MKGRWRATLHRLETSRSIRFTKIKRNLQYKTESAPIPARTCCDLRTTLESTWVD